MTTNPSSPVLNPLSHVSEVKVPEIQNAFKPKKSIHSVSVTVIKVMFTLSEKVRDVKKAKQLGM